MDKSSLIDVMRQKDTLTSNDAITHSTSLNNCVDLFFIAGASRRMSEKEILIMFQRAYAEDKLLALTLLFWSRDIRGGAGERRFFRIIWNHLVKTNNDIFVSSLLPLIPEYGRWDDIWKIESFRPLMSNYLSIKISEIILGTDNSLLCKWLPRKGMLFEMIRKRLKMTPKELRKVLVNNSHTVEQQMCEKDWKHIVYSHIPSVAFARYRKAFNKHDETRFQLFLENVKKHGDEKINANAIFPHDVIKGDISVNGVDEQWANLPDYMENYNGKLLPVCDVSGSMGIEISGRTTALDVCIALGLYISERNKGIFKDAFMTFSENPEMNYIKGDTISDRYSQLHSAEWGLNTDLYLTFKVLLNKALDNNISSDEMPDTLLIMSDMEFDSAVENSTNYEAIEALYTSHGYKIPKIVFWNLQGRIGNVPVNCNVPNTALVSGFSPAILKSILKNEKVICTPLTIMLDTLNSERYDLIRSTLS